MPPSLAYLISAHTDAPQLRRLIEALHPEAEYFVHIDLKSSIAPFLRELGNFPNVHFIPERVNVRWGTMLEVEYQMNLIRAAVHHPRHFDHIFFLSGMDYPLWSRSRISQFLRENAGREFLQGICLDTPDIGERQRRMYTISRPFFRSPRLSILAREALKLTSYRKKRHFQVEGREWKLYKGSAWWCISEELAAFVLEQYETKPQIAHYFRDSFCPAETLIQTIAFNSPHWAGRCILSEGPYQSLAALTPLHFIEYDPVIKILDESDLDRLLASGKMFCRKVVSGRSDNLVDELIERNMEVQSL